MLRGGQDFGPDRRSTFCSLCGLNESHSERLRKMEEDWGKPVSRSHLLSIDAIMLLGFGNLYYFFFFPDSYIVSLQTTRITIRCEESSDLWVTIDTVLTSITYIDSAELHWRGGRIS